MKRFIPITRKINAIIIISLVVGIGIIIVYFAYNQNLTLRNTTYESLNQQSDILYQSIEKAMLPGEAPLAVSLLSKIKEMNPAYAITFKILRVQRKK